MPLSIDVKPLGAIVEYTLKPILDDVIFVVEELEKKGLKLDSAVLGSAVRDCGRLYIFSAVLNALVQICCVSVVCFTAWRILH